MPRKQRHTAKRLFDRVRDECGFTGDYTIIRDYMRERALHRREVFVPLLHPPGHTQADFGEAMVVKCFGNGPRYRSLQFGFHVIDIAAELADRGEFIVPQTSAAFRYSGAQCFRGVETGPAAEYQKLSGFRMHEGPGVDTSMHKDDWKDTSIICEIACYEFAQDRARQWRVQDRLRALPVPAVPHRPAEQLALL
ncbi:hypothetical protein ROS1_57570 [Roseibium sp. ROS1]